MILNSRSDLFRVDLPKIFVPSEVKELFNPYVFKLPMPIKDISELINFSIQSITIPSFTYTPIEQTQKAIRGTERKYRAGVSPEMLIDRNFSITFQLLDGYINYWILLDTFLYYYSFENPTKYVFNVPVDIYDTYGNLLFRVTFIDCLFAGLTEFSLSYADNTPEFKTFDCNFEFNNLSIDFPIQ